MSTTTTPPTPAPTTAVALQNTLTLEQVSRALPPHLKKAATQSLVDQLNNAASDPEMAQAIRDNFISYTRVLAEGKFKAEDYLNAVKYVSFKLMGESNQDAYFKTFPQRHQALVARGASPQDISAYVSMYAKGKLVNLILEQTIVPTWVLNADLHQKAINVLASEMTDYRNSGMVRVTAATNLLTALQKPKEIGPMINLDLRETSGMQDLKNTIRDLANQQRQLIGAGVTTREIAGQRIVEGEPLKPVE